MSLQKKILVTGGAGYIGSHIAVKLLFSGFSVVVYVNLSNSSQHVIDRIKKLTGRHFDFIKGDLRDRSLLRKRLREHSFSAIIHCCGLKAVGESEVEPLKYYDNNVSGSIILFDEMIKAGINTIVFSSSATVYGDTDRVQYCENTPLAPNNVYGRTKLMVENVLRDLNKSKPDLRVALLRYFNPVGAHESGLIGENPAGIPNNLMPFIAQVAIEKRPELLIFGNDYSTHDGTGVRDYIHVEDLAAGHLAALKVLYTDSSSLITVNLGTGRPYSVLEVIAAFEKVSKKKIPYKVVGRRFGDLDEYYADSSLAKKLLGWESQLDIYRMCADTWRWQKNNPKGYDE